MELKIALHKMFVWGGGGIISSTGEHEKSHFHIIKEMKEIICLIIYTYKASQSWLRTTQRKPANNTLYANLSNYSFTDLLVSVYG